MRVRVRTQLCVRGIEPSCSGWLRHHVAARCGACLMARRPPHEITGLIALLLSPIALPLPGLVSTHGHPAGLIDEAGWRGGVMPLLPTRMCLACSETAGSLLALHMHATAKQPQPGRVHAFGALTDNTARLAVLRVLAALKRQYMSTRSAPCNRNDVGDTWQSVARQQRDASHAAQGA